MEEYNDQDLWDEPQIFTLRLEWIRKVGEDDHHMLGRRMLRFAYDFDRDWYESDQFWVKNKEIYEMMSFERRLILLSYYSYKMVIGMKKWHDDVIANIDKVCNKLKLDQDEAVKQIKDETIKQDDGVKQLQNRIKELTVEIDELKASDMDTDSKTTIVEKIGKELGELKAKAEELIQQEKLLIRKIANK